MTTIRHHFTRSILPWLILAFFAALIFGSCIQPAGPDPDTTEGEDIGDMDDDPGDSGGPTSPPPWSPSETVLRSTGGTTDHQFGWSVAVDGDRAIVSTPHVNSSTGEVYFFHRSGSVWTQVDVGTASDGQPGDLFGWSVSISGDLAVVGAFWEDGGAGDPQTKEGAAYIFEWNGTSWDEIEVLRASDAEPDAYFGASVDIDGERVIVGAYSGDAGGPGISRGAAYIYERSGGIWNESILRPNDGVNGDRFGKSVSISGDFAVIGTEYGNASSDGSAYIYKRIAGVWTQGEELVASDSQSTDKFAGNSVSIDDTRVVIGAHGEDGGAGDPSSSSGAAYVFDFDGANWVETTILRPTDSQSLDRFGFSVSVFGDMVAVGAYSEAGGAGDPAGSSGALYIFELDGAWSEVHALRASDAEASDYLGYSVSLGDRTVAAGAYGDNGPAGEPADNRGAVYVWQ